MNRHEKALQILAEGTVIPATPLALDENRHFDQARQKLLTRYYLEAGAGGIATAVHSTQFEIRDPKINLFGTVLETVASVINAHTAILLEVVRELYRPARSWTAASCLSFRPRRRGLTAAPSSWSRTA